MSAEAIDSGLVAEIAEILARAADEPAAFLSSGELEAMSRYEAASGDEIARALAGSAVQRKKVEAASLTVKQVAELLGVQGSRVRQRLLDRTLMGFKAGNIWQVYGWQFIEGEELPGMRDVNRALRPGIDVLVLHGFLTNPSVDLVVAGERVSPLQWLQARLDPRPVASIAAAL
ncbi:MAG: hypothetical protein ABFS21_08520 [Actinomycetota bacterium]